MEQIKELGNIIQQQKPEVFKELAQADSKKGMLLRAIMEGLVRSDNEASMLIYGKIDQGKKYQMLKRNLKENLIEHINHVTQKNQAFHLQVESECKEKLRLVASLLTNNVFHNAEKILNQVFKKAEQHHIYDVLAEAAALYRQVFSIKGYPDQAEVWDKKVNHYQTISQNHIQAKGFHQIIKSYFVHRCSLLQSQEEKAKEAKQKIKDWIKFSYSPFLALYNNQISMLELIHGNRVSDLTSYITSTEQLVAKNPFLENNVLSFNLLLNKARISICKGRLNKAEEEINASLETSDYKSFLKFEAQALNFSLKLKQHNYKEAGKIIQEVTSTYEFGLFHKEAKAAWYVKKVYLFLALKSINDNKSIETYLSDISPSTLLLDLDQNCKKLSRDKMGYHVQYLIIRLLLNWQNIADENYYNGKNLQLYYYRNLKEIRELRVKYFFKNLASIAVNEFNKEDILERKIEFTQKIADINYVYTYDLNELIPFETIFNILDPQN
jgi:hypothetical protein